MKKLLLSLLALFAVLSASADQLAYTINFATGSGTGGSQPKNNSPVSEIVAEDSQDFVTGNITIKNFYNKSQYGARIGAAAGGSLKFNLSEVARVKATKVMVTGMTGAGSSKNKIDNVTLTFNGASTPKYTYEKGTNVAYSHEFVLSGDIVETFEFSTDTGIYIQKIEVYVADGGGDQPDPEVAPETPVVTVNGAVYGDNDEIEVVKGDLVVVESKNATEILVNGESQPVEDGVYEFIAETSDIYTFQGKDGDKTSEEVTVMLDVDDLSWQTVVEGEAVEMAGSFVFAEFDTLVFNDATGIVENTKPASGKAVNISSMWLTSGDVKLTATQAGTNYPRVHNYGGTTQFRVYAGASFTISIPNGAISKITIKRCSGNSGTLFDGDTSFGETTMGEVGTFEWTPKEGTSTNSVTYNVGANIQIASIDVTYVSGGSETMVKAPEFYVGDVKLDASGDYAHGIKVEAGAVIKIMSHERTHLHYYVDGEEEAAANVKALMTVNEEEIPWIANESAQKHVFKYTVPAQQTKDITIHAKGVKEGYKSVAARMVLSADRIATGIDGIEAEGAEGVAEYFNLQGQRVMNPANGLFIKKTGEKVAKVIL